MLATVGVEIMCGGDVCKWQGSEEMGRKEMELEFLVLRHREWIKKDKDLRLRKAHVGSRV